MIRPEKTLSPEVRALLEREREIPPMPAGVRTRAVARARAALAAGVATAPVPARSSARPRWAAGVVLAFAASAAVGATAYEIRAGLRSELSARPPIELAAPVVVSSAPAVPKTGVASVREDAFDVNMAPPVATARLRPSPADAMHAELRLLRRARAAVARDDYAAAMFPIVEHARRFKNGRLAEEREALRVKSLAGLGRTEEARRAAASFQARFPHSVLSPAVNRMPVTPP